MAETTDETIERIMDSLVRALECDWIDASEHEPFTHLLMDYEGGIVGAVLFRLIDGLAEDYPGFSVPVREAKSLQRWEDQHGIPAYLILGFRDVTRCMRAYQQCGKVFDVKLGSPYGRSDPNRDDTRH